MQHNFLHHLPCFYTGDDGLDIFPLMWALHGGNLLLGIPFSFSLLTILMAHEMGHYLYCQRYGVTATPPFFIPFPSLFGTMGAFIRIRSSIRSREALFDIGIAGPIAGFVVALVILWISLGLSSSAQITAGDAIVLNYPRIFWVMNFLYAAAHGRHAVSVNQIGLHPMAIAAWVGMFATALNLLPGGQLDGGHIVFSLAPGAHRIVSRLAILALLPLAYYFWAGWLIWAVLLGLSGMRHPVVPRWPNVDPSRWALALVALVMLALTLTPAPVAGASLPVVIRQLLGH
jgi:membrane-associated protease RseP (regulator of RpoE activity)